MPGAPRLASGFKAPLHQAAQRGFPAARLFAGHWLRRFQKTFPKAGASGPAGHGSAGPGSRRASVYPHLQESAPQNPAPKPSAPRAVAKERNGGPWRQSRRQMRTCGRSGCPGGRDLGGRGLDTAPDSSWGHRAAGRVGHPVAAAGAGARGRIVVVGSAWQRAGPAGR